MTCEPYPTHGASLGRLNFTPSLPDLWRVASQGLQAWASDSTIPHLTCSKLDGRLGLLPRAQEWMGDTPAS